MSRLPQQDALSSSLQAGGGFGQFKAVSERPKEFRDGPFGPPKESAAQPQAPVAKHPAANIRRHELKSSTPTSKPQSPISRPSEVESPETAEASRFSEKVSLPLTLSLRERSEQFAKRLNRARTVRKTRITSNSVIRVALEVFLDSFNPPTSQAINSEEELLKAARHKSR